MGKEATLRNGVVSFVEGLFTRDGLENLAASLGGGNDKRSRSRFTNCHRLSSDSPIELNNMYRTSWAAGKVVDIIPDDMTREWRRFTNDDPKIVEALEEEERRLNLKAHFNQSHKWGRLYGTCGLVLALDDDEPNQPIAYDRLKPGSFRHVKSLDRTLIHQDIGTKLTLDPMDVNFGMPEFYKIQQTGTSVHNERMLRFDGVKLPHYELQHAGYMNDSVLDRVYDSILNFSIATDGAASMIFNMNVDVVSIEGLMNMLQTDVGEELIKKRFSLVSMMKSFNNMVVKDTKETWESRTHSFAGLPDLIEKFGKILAAATDIPATRLLGSSPGGLNATGESDMRNYYDMLKSRQVNEYGPMLYRIDRLMAANIGLNPDTDLTYEWNPLVQLSEKEQGELENQRSTRDVNYIREGVIDGATVARELSARGTYNNIPDDLLEHDDPEDPEAALNDPKKLPGQKDPDNPAQLPPPDDE